MLRRYLYFNCHSFCHINRWKEEDKLNGTELLILYLVLELHYILCHRLNRKIFCFHNKLAPLFLFQEFGHIALKLRFSQ
jgi:hypothetical protein